MVLQTSILPQQGGHANNAFWMSANSGVLSLGQFVEEAVRWVKILHPDLVFDSTIQSPVDVLMPQDWDRNWGIPWILRQLRQVELTYLQCIYQKWVYHTGRLTGWVVGWLTAYDFVADTFLQFQKLCFQYWFMRIPWCNINSFPTFNTTNFANTALLCFPWLILPLRFFTGWITVIISVQMSR